MREGEGSGSPNTLSKIGGIQLRCTPGFSTKTEQGPSPASPMAESASKYNTHKIAAWKDTLESTDSKALPVFKPEEDGLQTPGK